MDMWVVFLSLFPLEQDVHSGLRKQHPAKLQETRLETLETSRIFAQLLKKWISKLQR